MANTPRARNSLPPSLSCARIKQDARNAAARNSANRSPASAFVARDRPGYLLLDTRTLRGNALPTRIRPLHPGVGKTKPNLPWAAVSFERDGDDAVHNSDVFVDLHLVIAAHF